MCPTRRALDDRRAEQSLRSGRDEVVAHRHAARRFARDGDLVRVAAEVGDVVPDPAQRRLLVLQSVVADVAGRTERRMREEPERAEPVVDGDDDDVAARHQPAAVVDLPLPPVNEPPWIHTMTGRGAPVVGGVHTFRLRQSSSLCFPNSRIGTGVLDAARPRFGGVAYSLPCRRAAQADGSAAGPQAVPRKGCRRTTDDPTRPGRGPCRWPSVPARYPTAARASGPPATAPRGFPGGPTSAMPRRAVRAQPPAPSPSRRSGPPAGFEPSLAARSPSLRRLSPNRWIAHAAIP